MSESAFSYPVQNRYPEVFAYLVCQNIGYLGMAWHGRALAGATVLPPFMVAPLTQQSATVPFEVLR